MRYIFVEDSLLQYLRRKPWQARALRNSEIGKRFIARELRNPTGIWSDSILGVLIDKRLAFEFPGN